MSPSAEMGVRDRAGLNDTGSADLRLGDADVATVKRQRWLSQELRFGRFVGISAVFRVDLPPFRERIGEVDLVAQHFLSELNREHGTRKRLPPHSLAFDHSWPGNVRELRNVIHDAFIMADEELIIRPLTHKEKSMGPASLEATAMAETNEANSSLHIRVGTTAAEAERRLIMATLDACAGNKNRAAAILGVSLKTVYNRLHAYRTLGQSGVSGGQPVSIYGQREM